MIVHHKIRKGALVNYPADLFLAMLIVLTLQNALGKF
jgi:hypothetical protein